MPRNVRNFWVEVDSDARGRAVGTGPISKDGIIDVHCYVRNHGSVVDSFRLAGRALGDGRLELTVFGPDGREIGKHETVR